MLALGLFAVPEIVHFLRRDQAIASTAKLTGGWLAGARGWARSWLLSVRCAGIGCIVGAIPGLGGTVVDWIA